MKAWILVFSVVCLSASITIAAETKKSDASLNKAIDAINKNKDKNEKEFITLAETKNDSIVIKALKADKDHALINVKIRDDHILTYCIKNKMWKSAEELIKDGSNLNHRDKEGKVALMYAAESKNRYLATMIIASKADKKIKDKAGVTAEEYLKKNGLL